MPQYPLGAVIRLSANFKTNNTNSDPTTVSVTVKTPLGVKTTLVYGTDQAVVRDSIGNYYYNYAPAIEGRYAFRWSGTGNNIGANETTFDVSESLFN